VEDTALPLWFMKIDGTTKQCSFEDLQKSRELIEQVILLYKYNSYVVNVRDKTFIVNGGMTLSHKNSEKIKDPILLHAKRNTLTMKIGARSVRTEDDGHTVSYLVGFQDRDGGEQALIQVSEDGTHCTFLDRR